jgi:hypothetical protein
MQLAEYVCSIPIAKGVCKDIIGIM